MLKFPKHDLSSFHEAIQSARIVETKTVMAFARVSRHLAAARKEVSTAKFKYNTRLKRLLADDRFTYGKTLREQKLFAEASLVEEQRALDEATDNLNKITVYLSCIDKVLANAKHHREDISKRIKVLEVEHGIQEVD